jgi:hypothetical protein
MAGVSIENEAIRLRMQKKRLIDRTIAQQEDRRLTPFQKEASMRACEVELAQQDESIAVLDRLVARKAANGCEVVRREQATRSAMPFDEAGDLDVERR